MKKQPSVFDIEARLRENKPTPPADQKQAILASLTSIPQELPAVPAKKRVNWKLVSTCCMLAVVLLGAGAWFGRDYLFGTTERAFNTSKDLHYSAEEDLTSGKPTDPAATYATAASVTTGAATTLSPTMAMTTAALTAGTRADAELVFPEGTITVLGREPGDTFEPTTGESDDVIEPSAPTVDPVAGLLTAGEWCDNKDYEFFTNLFTDERWAPYVELYGLAPVERYVVTVADANGEPARSVTVTLTDADGNALASAVTDHTGTAYLFAMNKTIAERAAFVTTETYDGLGAPITETEAGLGAALVLPAEKPTVLDLMFVIDTTGSMWDELAYLQVELADVVARVEAENPDMTIRLSFNFYRDEGDAYVVLPSAFTEDIGKALEFLAEQWADAGGDNPEAVHTALENALYDHEWSEHSVKLLFFVLDAPAHTEDPAVLASLRQSLPQFAAEGIRIIPVASSGVGPDCEYFLRTCATLTGGTYTFLTNHSGIGGDHAEPMIGQYAVRPLNDLLVEITNRYCK